MNYLATEKARARRANPKEILPECKSILVLATPYNPPLHSAALSGTSRQASEVEAGVRVAAYARAEDYHNILPARMDELVRFIEKQVERPIKNRYYTDTGPILERDLAQRAGIGWIGKNTCLINPKQGSYFFISEIFLDLELEPDAPFVTDHCGTCARCITACPTDCILPNRALDATRCISYLTIELKGPIPEDLRPAIGDRVFGCDDCLAVCPWNRFAREGRWLRDHRRGDLASLPLLEILELDDGAFRRRFTGTPMERSQRRGLRRNACVALGNVGDATALPALGRAAADPEPLVAEHAHWAIERIQRRERGSA